MEIHSLFFGFITNLLDYFWSFFIKQWLSNLKNKLLQPACLICTSKSTTDAINGWKPQARIPTMKEVVWNDYNWKSVLHWNPLLQRLVHSLLHKIFHIWFISFCAALRSLKYPRNQTLKREEDHWPEFCQSYDDCYKLPMGPISLVISIRL